MIQKQSKVILVNYKENYDTTTTTIQWVLTSVQLNLVCVLSQTGSWEILVRVAIPTRTVCARGYSYARGYVRVAKSRARILYTKTHPDCPGGNSEKIKQITEAYRLIGDFIEENYNLYNNDHEEVIAREAFKQFNFSDVKENLRPYTIKIENHLSHFGTKFLPTSMESPWTDKIMVDMVGGYINVYQ